MEILVRQQRHPLDLLDLLLIGLAQHGRLLARNQVVIEPAGDGVPLANQALGALRFNAALQRRLPQRFAGRRHPDFIRGAVRLQTECLAEEGQKRGDQPLSPLARIGRRTAGKDEPRRNARRLKPVHRAAHSHPKRLPAAHARNRRTVALICCIPAAHRNKRRANPFADIVDRRAVRPAPGDQIPARPEPHQPARRLGRAPPDERPAAAQLQPQTHTGADRPQPAQPVRRPAPRNHPVAQLGVPRPDRLQPRNLAEQLRNRRRLADPADQIHARLQPRSGLRTLRDRGSRHRQQRQRRGHA